MDLIESHMKSAGLNVSIFEYDVLLSYPSRANPNYVAVKVKESGEEFDLSSKVEEILDDSQDNPLVFNPFM